jgi:hypothetical protein
LSANIRDGALVTHDLIRTFVKRDILARQHVHRWIDDILELLVDLTRRRLVLAPQTGDQVQSRIRGFRRRQPYILLTRG